MNNILVVNVNWMGDVLFSAPIFPALKKAFPNAYVSCMAVPRVADVLRYIPGIDEIIIFDEKGRHWHPFGKLGLIWELKRRKFDIAFLLHGSLTRAWLAYLAGIPRRVGYNVKNHGNLLTDEVSPLKDQHHRSDYYIRVVEAVGVKVENRSSTLDVSKEVLKEADALLNDNGIADGDEFVVVHPGGNWDLKRWPVENFSSFMAQAAEEYSFKIVLSGSKNDLNLAKEITQHMVQPPVVLTGKTNLKQLMGLMKRARLVISADSGPLHLASSVGTRVVGLFGPTRPEVTGPRGQGKAVILQHDVGCNQSACYHLQCPDNVCMQAITVKDVLRAVREVKD